MVRILLTLAAIQWFLLPDWVRADDPTESKSDFQALAERIEGLSEEEQVRFARNLERWLRLSPEQRGEVREEARGRAEAARREMDDLVEGLDLEPPQAREMIREFRERVREIRRELQQNLRRELERQTAELREELRQKFSEPEPSASSEKPDEDSSGDDA